MHMAGKRLKLHDILTWQRILKRMAGHSLWTPSLLISSSWNKWNRDTSQVCTLPFPLACFVPCAPAPLNSVCAKKTGLFYNSNHSVITFYHGVIYVIYCDILSRYITVQFWMLWEPRRQPTPLQNAAWETVPVQSTQPQLKNAGLRWLKELQELRKWLSRQSFFFRAASKVCSTTGLAEGMSN